MEKVAGDLFNDLFRGIIQRDRRLLFKTGEGATAVKIKLMTKAGSQVEQSVVFRIGYVSALAEMAYTFRDRFFTRKEKAILRRRHAITILEMVDHSPNLNQTAIAQTLKVRSSHLTNLLQKLIKADFLCSERRGVNYFLVLSPKGALVMEKLNSDLI